VICDHFRVVSWPVHRHDGFVARFRLPRTVPPRPAARDRGLPKSVALVIPALNEAGTIGAVISRLPATVCGMTTTCIVVDDGSTDDTVGAALRAGAKVTSHSTNRGLGAAVRTGLQLGVQEGCEMIAFCDGDGEYDPNELEAVVAPIAHGSADYVVGSRFTGSIERMHVHRRVGNVVLTKWVRWMTRLPVTDGQSGYRAMSRSAASNAVIVHDYNYAQVLTLDLVAKGYRYAEVPISYSFRTGGRSFVRLLPYLRRVIPATMREIGDQSSTT
jgi:glycosyltransferase involved in cell wall biosynthesis